MLPAQAALLLLSSLTMLRSAAFTTLAVPRSFTSVASRASPQAMSQLVAAASSSSFSSLPAAAMRHQRQGGGSSSSSSSSSSSNGDGGRRAPWLRMAAMMSAGGATASVSTTAGEGSDNVAPPPSPEKIDHKVKFGAVEGEVRGDNPMKKPIEVNDPLFWMRDDKRTDEKVIGRLKQENAYSADAMKPLEGFKDSLYSELLSHVKETDATAAYPKGDWQYFTRTVEGLSYSIHCRQPRGKVVGKDPEEVVLDENLVAKANTASSFTAVGNMKTSPSQEVLAWTCDTFGGETYDLIISDISKGSNADKIPKELDRIKDVDSGIVWGADDKTVYYLKMDDEHRPFQVWRHTVGEASDELMYEETNPLFWVSVSKTLDGKFILISTDSSETSEVHTIDLSDSSAGAAPKAKVVAERNPGVLYGVDHRDGYFFITTNAGGNTNFRVVTAPVGSPGADSWAPLNDGIFADGSDTSPGAVMIDGVTCFKDFVAVEGRANGFTKVWMVEMGAGARVKSYHPVDFFGNEAISAGLSANAEFDTPSVRVGYSSLVDPPSTLEYAVNDRELSLVKRKDIPNYDPASYGTARVIAKAHDGAEIPMSLVFHKDLVDAKTGAPKAPAPMHLYGYGSYGICIDPDFSPKRLPLLNRGMVYAIAHIRGGAEMGRSWYEEQGKYLNKRNTFMDFISCAEHLHAAGWSSPELTSTEGRSAGGLLMGACLNMRPDLFKVAVAGVPFVDVMTTMCDASIPLTVGEWEEWGNPNEAKYFNYMMSYSPMNNIIAQDYPSILVTAGLHDPRVAYWEPMKWVAAIRDVKTDDNPLLLKVDLEAGHFSASDRYKYLKELSFDYAFLLDQLGLKDTPVKK